MTQLRTLGRLILDALPAQSTLLYRFGQRCVDRYRGDNNSDPASNGEEQLLRSELAKLKGACIFDVGANVGHWTRFALQLDPSAVIHCFEPSAATFRRLAANEWPKNVIVNNIALGETSGVADLNVFGDESGLNSMYARRGVAAAQIIRRETIKVRTADEYCAEHGVARIDIVKADVEGHELSVLKGMRRMLSENRVGLIQFEYGGANLDSRVFLRDIWEYLEPFGFEFFKLFPEGPRRLREYRPTLETFQYSNYVARASGT